jgi:translation initiation factor IF-2
VGCPSDGGGAVTFSNAPKGPGWTPAGGGWTGNGCDGSTLWTMDPNGKQPAPSTLTWTFNTAGASRCTLAVFVPTQNALGVSDYSVSVGPAAASQVVGAVPVSQSAEAGQWLTLGTYPVSGSLVEITTAPAPGASGPGHHGAIAASAARAACS